MRKIRETLSWYESGPEEKITEPLEQPVEWWSGMFARRQRQPHLSFFKKAVTLSIVFT